MAYPGTHLMMMMMMMMVMVMMMMMMMICRSYNKMANIMIAVVVVYTI